MKIQIKLLSDLCTCSGETYNSIVDTDVTYDENGIPYIPAKRIRGCIREAGLEMLEFGLIIWKGRKLEFIVFTFKCIHFRL